MSDEAQLALDYFDGRSARALPAQASVEGGELHVQTERGLLRYAVASVVWPERQRHGQRQAILPDGGLLVCADAQAWDDWARGTGRVDSLTVRLMQSWRSAAVAGLLVMAALFGLWRWGAPVAAQAIVAAMPQEVGEEVGRQTLDQLDEHLLKPSKLAPEERARITRQFADFVAASGTRVPYELSFRDAGEAIGPNAFALPGSTIILTDELVTLMRDQPAGIMGVLGHEYGHLRHRHAMRGLVQAGLLSVAAGLFIGDYSSLLAGAPVLFAHMAYSRDFEREADSDALRMLQAAHQSPQGMVIFFERMAKKAKDRSGLPIAFSSHPASAERIRFFGGPAEPTP